MLTEAGEGLGCTARAPPGGCVMSRDAVAGEGRLAAVRAGSAGGSGDGGLAVRLLTASVVAVPPGAEAAAALPGTR